MEENVNLHDFDFVLVWSDYHGNHWEPMYGEDEMEKRINEVVATGVDRESIMIFETHYERGQIEADNAQFPSIKIVSTGQSGQRSTIVPFRSSGNIAEHWTLEDEGVTTLEIFCPETK